MSKKRRAKIPPFRVLNSENIFRKFVSKIMRSCDKNFAQLHYRCSDSSITDLITDLFWDEHNQEMLEKYVKEEREWESTHEYDHFLEDLGLYSVICLDGCIGCAPWRTFGCTTVVDSG